MLVGSFDWFGPHIDGTRGGKGRRLRAGWFWSPDLHVNGGDGLRFRSVRVVWQNEPLFVASGYVPRDGHRREAKPDSPTWWVAELHVTRVHRCAH
ncbi:hypothetical protein GCM10027068_35140 [Prescottella soli]